MTTQEIIVTLAGLGAIVWVNYYFFFAGRGVVRKRDERHGR
ncbi:MAG: hypothetical protein ACREMX_09450 [Gemmatimonadales bacterium]